MEQNPLITLAMARDELSVPLLCDAMDGLGYRNQSPITPLRNLTARHDEPQKMLVGFAKTTLWADMAHVDPKPYELELAAVDSCEKDHVIVCAAGGSMRSGIWGELLSTSARNRGVEGVIVDGAIRDVSKMRDMGFPAYALGTCPYDSKDRQRVIDFDVAIEIEGIRVEPGDLVGIDEDGMAVVPKHLVDQVLLAAWTKAHEENKVREAIRSGMSATQAFKTFGVL